MAEDSVLTGVRAKRIDVLGKRSFDDQSKAGHSVPDCHERESMIKHPAELWK
jgi:hypothetical protein